MSRSSSTAGRGEAALNDRTARFWLRRASSPRSSCPSRARRWTLLPFRRPRYAVASTLLNDKGLARRRTAAAILAIPRSPAESQGRFSKALPTVGNALQGRVKLLISWFSGRARAVMGSRGSPDHTPHRRAILPILPRIPLCAEHPTSPLNVEAADQSRAMRPSLGSNLPFCDTAATNCQAS